MIYNRIMTLVAAIIIFGMASCTDNTPKGTAEKFLNAFYHMDYETARQVSTPKAIELINLMEQFSLQQPDSARKNAKKIKIELLDVKEYGNTAIVTYTESSSPGEQKLKLEKQNGKWLVSRSKEDDIEEDSATEPVIEQAPPTTPTDSTVRQ
jgi:hypothetical protein